MFVCGKIHNDSIGRLFEVDTIQEGIDFIIGMAEEQLGRTLTDDELSCIENDHELYNDEDMDNHYTWFVAQTERP